MLLQLLIEQPQAIGTIVQRTPIGVWGLLAALLMLGGLQMRARSIGPVRAALLPLGLAVFSLGGLSRDLSASPWLGSAVGLWFLLAAAVVLLGWHAGPPAGTRYEPGTRRIHLPGSATPLFIILAIFLLKYAIAVELSLQPLLRLEAGFALGLGSVNGALSGLLATRSAALWRMAARRAPA